MRANCRIQIRNPVVTKPPFEFITLGEFTCDKPENDYLGERFADILYLCCMELGFMFKSYSLSLHHAYAYDIMVLEE